MNILIVDDHAINRRLLRMQLQAEGHRVLEATHGIEALEILDRESVDGVVSDILMPSMDGFRLCLEIRKRKNLATLPFVFYTGTFKSPQDQELARTVGADQYLTKPSTAREILGALEQAMQQTRDRIAVSAARHDETYVLKQYNESLVRKLEEQNLELEGAFKELQTAHRETHESEAQLRLFVEHAPAAIAMVDREMRYLAVSRRWLTDYRVSDKSITGRSHYDVFPEIPERWKEIHRRCLAGAVEKCEEDPFPRADGSLDWVRWEIHPWRRDSGEIGGIILFSEVITERKLQQQKIERLSRIRALSSGINAAIIRAGSRQDLLDEACRITVEHGGFGIAWIGSFDPVTLDVTPVAWAGLEAKEFLSITKSTARGALPQGQGAVGRAIRELRPVVSNDISAETGVGSVRRAEALRRGYRSVIVLPLIVDGTVNAIFSMFAKEVHYFDDAEVKLLAEIAGNISFALEHIARQQKIEKLSRIRVVSSEINAAIVYARNPQSLFEQACHIAVEQGRLGSAWIGSLDAVTLDITPVAWAGAGSEEMRTTRSTARDDPLHGQGAVSRAVRERRAVFNNDLSLQSFGDPRLETVLKLGFRSMIALPLFEGDKVVGTFTLYARETGFFDEDEVALLTELAGNVSFALEHMARQQRIGKLSRIRAVSSEINAAITRVRDRQELLDATCNIAVEQAGFPLAWIGMLDPATQDLKPAAMAGAVLEYGKLLQPSVRGDIPAGQGTSGRAFRATKPVVDNDLAADPNVGVVRGEGFERGIRAALSLPLLVEGAPIGVMGLYAKEKDYFDDEEISLLTEVAGNISFALEHMARQQKLDKLSRIRAISSEINVAIVRVRERNALLEKACRIVSEQGKFEMVWIGTISHEKQEVQPVAWTGFSEETARAVNWAGISTSKGTLGEAIQTRKPSVRHDIDTEIPGGKLREEALKRGCRSTVCLPLVVDDRVTALIVLFASGRGFFDKDELALLDEVASNISFALEHIEREEKIARHSRIEAVTGSISGLIARVGDRDELFREACRIAVDEGRFRMSLIGIVDRSTMKIVPVASAGKDEELLASIKGVLSSSENAPKTMVARAIREKKAVVSNDSQSDSAVLFGKKYAESGVHSMAILPLIVSDEVVGVLALYAEETGFFDDEEMRLLTELTGNIAFAIDHIVKQERLDYLAYYDALTGLANRTLFLERVAQSIRSAVSGGHKLALFLIDLDRFKNINDSLGRTAGDALLKQVAAWMTSNMGGADLLARVDADHFAVVLPEVRQEGDVARIIEKSMDAFLEHPFLLRDAVFRIAAKVGVALFPDDGADADTLFRNAEAALKKAKSSGERYLFHTKKMTEAVAAKLALENQLREALDKGEFVLHYQPKVDLASGAVCGLEALIRWQKPGSGLVAPGTFIPLLEETGLILGVGRWALSKALAQHREWTARGIAAPRIAVNVSAIQLQQKNFADVVINAVQEQGDNPDALELEITESLLMLDVQENIRSLSILRGLGIHIAMDDFGTGYSSLSYIARLPINCLKIDRSFINGMGNSPQDMAIVTTIIALAHSLNLRVVAEGVETAAQSKLLKLLKCDEAQGFLISKPLPAAEIEPLLRTLTLEASEPERVQ